MLTIFCFRLVLASQQFESCFQDWLQGHNIWSPDICPCCVSSAQHALKYWLCMPRLRIEPRTISLYTLEADYVDSDSEEHNHLQDAITKGWFRKVPTEEDSPVNVKHLLLTAREIAGAMSYLHDEDILHSDLTGGNILLGASTKDERGYTALVSLSLMSGGCRRILCCQVYAVLLQRSPSMLLGTASRNELAPAKLSDWCCLLCFAALSSSCSSSAALVKHAARHCQQE